MQILGTCVQVKVISHYFEAYIILSGYYYTQLNCNLYINFIEAGLFAIRAEREYVMDEDFMKAVRKVAENKKLETKLDYKPV